MNCWIIGVTLMCANGFGPAFIYNYNSQYDVPQRPAQVDYDAMFRSLGMRTNYEYFCKNRTNPIDADICTNLKRR